MKNILFIAIMLFTLVHTLPAHASESKSVSGVAATVSGVAATVSGVAATVSGVAATSAVSPTASPSNISPTPDWLINTAIFFSMAFAVFGIAATLIILGNYGGLFDIDNLGKKNKWRLAQALSEEVEISDASNPPIKKTIFVASSSRLVAFIALIVLVSLLVGVTPIIIWSYAKTGAMPNLDDLSKFLIACAGLFLPYIANQARAAIEK